MNYLFIVPLQVLAEREWTMATFRKCTEDVFKRLYPDEPKLRISSLQNEFHFDIPLSYKVDDVLVDAGLVFAVEEEISLVNSLRYLIISNLFYLECGRNLRPLTLDNQTYKKFQNLIFT